MSSPDPYRIAIVGRPNVGKSTLLNRLFGSRVSIVEPTAGVTRDRIGVRVELPCYNRTRVVEVIDTGGIGIVDRHDLGPHVEEQVRVATMAADLILFMVDVRDGVTPLDVEVARRLRGLSKPVQLVCNKADTEKFNWEVDAFRRLGIVGEPIAISAQNGDGMVALVERINELLPPVEGEAERFRPSLKLAIVGRRNAGKSTMVNALAKEERMIVSEIPGTTRDAVDVILERDGHTIVVIDTAGIKKKSSFDDPIDFFSDTRSYRAVRRADVALLLFDATAPLSGLEKRLARYVVDHHKPLVLGANKWDLARGKMEPEALETYLATQLPGVPWVPLSFLSAKSGWHVEETFRLCEELFEQSSLRVGTGELNRVLERALQAKNPSSKGHRVQIRYATQVSERPPRILLFVNDKRLVTKDYLRYLENRFREELPFKEIPMHFVLRDKQDAVLEET
ncbi:ribosome biogenesis GTPase Der [Engelhardtia mirabilis]|uniref:GTPase Der n=1 Tax=Engelhardtia mirabilis TaxID=2528011 RepID=A0A518BI81_9BACT|nr:GTPase Der [Planctomycetes bacterium Pla133]QDV01013.1 GTPase Der [Planctomycetes bacterium Pla86]